MSTTTATGPKQTVLDVLDASTAGEWSNAGGKPPRIADSKEYAPSDKAHYEAGDAVYVYQASGDEFTPQGTDTWSEQYRVSCDVWTLDGVARAEAVARDVQSILAAYWTDNSVETGYTTVRPIAIQDYTHESFADHGQHDRKLVEVRLMKLGTT